MKSKISAIVIAVSLFLVSCHWFSSKKKEDGKNPLIGEWRIDSLHAGKDTNLAYVFIGMAMKDSAGVQLRFTNDTLFTISGNSIDTSFYNYDSEKKMINFKEAVDQSYTVNVSGNANVTLQGKDSSAFFLQKNEPASN